MDRIVLEGPRGLRLDCDVAATRRERTRGLKARSRLGADEALWIPRASSVHTFGMRFAIRVARLDPSLRVIDVRVVPPNRMVMPSLRARSVLECEAEADVRVGDRFRTGQERSAQECSQERERDGRDDREDPDEQGMGSADPGGQRNRLATRPARRHEPEELQQRPHPSSIGSEVEVLNRVRPGRPIGSPRMARTGYEIQMPAPGAVPVTVHAPVDPSCSTTQTEPPPHRPPQ